MNRVKKKVFSVLLALVLVAALLPLGSAPAHAASNASWSGYTAQWQTTLPVGVEINTVTLYRDGTQVTSISGATIGTGGSFDMSAYITEPGNYTFKVAWISTPVEEAESGVLKVCQVTYAKGRDDAGGSMASELVIGGSSYQIKACGFTSPDNYRFDYWTVSTASGDFAPGDSITVNTNTTVTANWQEQVSITFDGNGGTGSTIDPNPAKVDKGSTYTLPACGYDPPDATAGFKCWEVKGVEMDPGDSFTANENTTVTAIWTPIYHITYDGNGGTGSMTEDTVEQGDPYTLPENGFGAPTDKRFKAWTIDSDTTERAPGYSFTPTADVAVKAKWQDTCTVSFEPNGGTGTMPSMTQDKGTTFTLPACTYGAPDNHYFKGWNVNGTLKQPNDTFTLTQNLEVTAEWQQTWTVSFDRNGGTGSKDPVTQDVGTAYNLPGANTFGAPHTWQEFDKWEVDGTPYDAGAAINYNTNVTAKALWKDKVYSVGVQTTGSGSIEPDLMQGTHGTTITLTISAEPGNELDTNSFSITKSDGTAVSYTRTDETHYTFAIDDSHVTVKGKFVKVAYKITQGAKGQWVKNSGVVYTLKVERTVNDSVTYGNFEELWINGKKLTTSQYDKSSGSVVLKVRASYLQTLTAAKGYPIRIVFEDDTLGTTAVNTTFDVLARRGVVTGDTNNLNLWLGLLILSGAMAGGAVILLTLRKKRKQ